MEIRIKNDSVEIEGYVNAVERKSKPLWSRMGQFVERIKKGAFKKAIERNDNIRILLNHDWNKDLGGTKDGNLELKEDNIGLHARATITDPEVVEKAKKGDLVGWSFGFHDLDVDEKRSDEDGMMLRDVKDLDLKEVSLLDKSKTPAYDGTLVSVRAEDESVLYHADSFEDEILIRAEQTETPKEEETKQQETVDVAINYDKWDALVADMKS